MSKYRIERDCLGEMEIPDNCYYGIQTTRMMGVSGCANLPVSCFPDMHKALAQIKKAAARANSKIGAMNDDIAEAIAQACDEIIEGKFADQFPLDMWQGGGYTCVNMNINEVVGNRANEILTGKKGSDRVHPNTHVNMGQSTNDTIPSATHLGMIARFDELIRELGLLSVSLRAKEREFKDIVKVGRTCLQDALPLTLGQEFGGYASVIERLKGQAVSMRAGCFEIVMGGSAVGTGFSAEPGYIDAFYAEISEQYGQTITPMKDLFDGFQNADFIVEVSGLVKKVAMTLSKISKDLRILGSGPRSGLMEINLPALSPGSSIMPGKINPTVPEMVIQISHQVAGNDVAISMAYDEGELDLNVWDATFYKCLFESFQLVNAELPILRKHCIDGITANKERCEKEANASIALSTVVAAALGYPLGVKVAHYCEKNNLSVKEAVVRMGLMTSKEADKLVNPMLMTNPKAAAQAVAEFKKEKHLI